MKPVLAENYFFPAHLVLQQNFFGRGENKTLFSLQNTTQTLLTPQTVKFPFVQYSNLVRRAGNANAIKGSQNEQNKDVQPWRGFLR